MNKPTDAEILYLASKVRDLLAAPGGEQLVASFTETHSEQPEEARPVFGSTDFSAISQHDTRIERLELKGHILSSQIRFGVPTGAYTSGATFVLDPCDPAGTDNGQDNVTVAAGWTLPANTNIPTTAIVPFLADDTGTFQVLGVPREVMTNIQYDTTTHKLQKKVRYDFGWFATTESSAWVDITTAVDCTAV